jgi:hypothetical protein
MSDKTITAELVPGSWERALRMCRNTMWKGSTDKEPSDAFKHALCRAEHGPLALVEYYIHQPDIKYWMTAHFTRHKFGVTWGQGSSRDDRHDNPLPRDEMPQGTSVPLDCQVNALELIYMARRRLCGMAHPETRKRMQEILDAVAKVDPIVVQYCVPNCIYRGRCPESKPCGYVVSDGAADRAKEYDDLFVTI